MKFLFVSSSDVRQVLWEIVGLFVDFWLEETISRDERDGHRALVSEHREEIDHAEEETRNDRW